MGGLAGNCCGVSTGIHKALKLSYIHIYKLFLYVNIFLNEVVERFYKKFFKQTLRYGPSHCSIWTISDVDREVFCRVLDTCLG